MVKKVSNDNDLNKLRLDAVKAGLSIGARKEKNTNLKKNLKKQIARILTKMNLKEVKNG